VDCEWSERYVVGPVSYPRRNDCDIFLGQSAQSGDNQLLRVGGYSALGDYHHRPPFGCDLIPPDG